MSKTNSGRPTTRLSALVDEVAILRTRRRDLRLQLKVLRELYLSCGASGQARRTVDVDALAELLQSLVPEVADLLELVRIYRHERAQGRAEGPEVVLLPLLERRADLEARVDLKVRKAELALASHSWAEIGAPQ